MKLYYLKTKVKSPSNAAIYPQGKIYDAIYDFSITEKVGSNELPKNLVARCQPGVSADDLLKLDYFRAYGEIPIFSNKFLSAATKINLEMDFVKTTLIAENAEAEFNIGRILNRMEIVDHDKSKTGSNIFVGIYLRRDIESNFYIAKEKNPLREHIFVVSDRFKSWASKNKLNIGYREVTYS